MDSQSNQNKGANMATNTTTERFPELQRESGIVGKIIKWAIGLTGNAVIDAAEKTAEVTIDGAYATTRAVYTRKDRMKAVSEMVGEL